MAFRFDLTTDLPTNVRHMWSRQLQKAERAAENAADDDTAIWQARKSFKRVRALLRLIRDGLQKKAWRAENIRYRDLGRQLAGARDAAAVVEALNGLALATGLEGSDLIAMTRQALQHPDRSNSPETAVQGVDLGALKAALAEARVAFDALDVTGLDRGALLRGYARAYGDGRREMDACYQTGESAGFHEWRKRVQHHWRQSLLLEGVWPEGMAPRIETARLVSKALGFDHDLSLLAEEIETVIRRRLSARHTARLLEAIAETQIRTRHAIRPLAMRLYGLSPDALSEQLDIWWAAEALAGFTDMSPLSAAAVPRVAERARADA
ncbi:MAG: CHAD domain-containing protein [Pseudomonadota bacterium]